MSSSFSSNSGSSSGSGSSAAPSGSAHASVSTSPKVAKKPQKLKTPLDKQAGPSTLEKFQDRMARNSSKAIVCSVKTPIRKIREKYYIPPKYEIIIPRAFDRVHRPPPGTKPSFDNFWSLYFFTTSKRSGDRGFFYLSAKPDCRYLDTLKSNVGSWRDRFIFVRPPPSITWPFKLEWSKYKLVPKTSGGGLEGDQINSLTSYKYDPKKLLTEKVLRLVWLSPAPLHIEESLDSIVMNSRFALWLKATENKAKGKQIVSSADPSLTPTAAQSPSRAPVPASPSVVQSPTLNNPIQLNLDDNRSEARREDLSEKRDRKSEGTNLKKRKRASHKQQEKAKDKGPAEPSGSSKSSQSSLPRLNRWAKSMSRMTKEAADKAEQQDERDRGELKGEQAHVSELKGDRLVPKWNISTSSSIFFTEPGEDSWDIYDFGILPRDQGSLAATFLRGLSMKCMSYRWNHMVSDKKVKDLSAQLAERDRIDRVHVEEMQTLAEEIQKLKDQLLAVDKAKEIALSEGRKEGFDAGREVGLVEGHKQGLEEGKAGRITLEEHHQAMTSSRIPTVRDFLKSDTFKTAVEIKSADFFTKGYKTCEAQLEKLGGFSESFDRSQMDITLDGNLQPYPDEPALEDDEFAALRDEIEPDP
ncbi:UNVERIFIED_CONTAM: hypothetical protein Sindi_2870700 [Sesamum indicum]